MDPIAAINLACCPSFVEYKKDHTHPLESPGDNLQLEFREFIFHDEEPQLSAWIFAYQDGSSQVTDEERVTISHSEAYRGAEFVTSLVAAAKERLLGRLGVSC